LLWLLLNGLLLRMRKLLRLCWRVITHLLGLHLALLLVKVLILQLQLMLLLLLSLRRR
jgi:hypothetical protein